MHRWTVRLIGALSLMACGLCGQSAPPEFDVASLKPSPPPTGNLYQINLGKVTRGELNMTNVSLADCLRFAYGITNDEQIVGPDWIRDKNTRFDIIAKAPIDTPQEQFPLMLRALLRERFRLMLHHESRNLSWLALRTAAGGPKLPAAQDGSDASGNQSRSDRIISNHMSMAVLATLLSRFLGETVIDETGLKGFYEVRLNWAPDALQRTAEPASPEREGESIYTAIQSQLGLKLQARKGPVDVIVVDSAQKVPVEN